MVPNALVVSTLPDAVDELLRRVRSRVDLDVTTVQDGPTKTGDWKSTVIIVGWSDENQSAFTVNNTGPRGLRSNDEEAWVIQVVIGAVSGATEGGVSKARRMAATALAHVHAALTEDMTLGGTCGVAVLRSVQWFQTVPGLKGPESILRFDIAGRAL